MIHSDNYSELFEKMDKLKVGDKVIVSNRLGKRFVKLGTAVISAINKDSDLPVRIVWKGSKGTSSASFKKEDLIKVMESIKEATFRTAKEIKNIGIINAKIDQLWVDLKTAVKKAKKADIPGTTKDLGFIDDAIKKADKGIENVDKMVKLLSL